MGFMNKGYMPEGEEREFFSDRVKEKTVKSKTPMLDRFGVDLTDLANKNELDPVIGRENEINQLVQILNKKKKNNALLVGEPGLGKSAIVEGFAQRIANKKNIDSNFFDCKVISLSLTSLVAGTKYRGEFEDRMEQLVKEASQNKNVIVFIDELHTVLGAGNSSGGMDASNILKPALARGEMRVIGATTLAEYQMYIEKDKAFERRFEKVKVNIPTRSETLQVLMNIKHVYEQHHKVLYSDEVISKIYDFSERYISHSNNPDRSIDLMDKVGSKIKLKNFAEQPQQIQDLKLKLEQINIDMQTYSDIQEYLKADDKKEERNIVLGQIEEAKSKWEEEIKNKKIQITVNDVAEVVSEQTGIPIKSMTENELDLLKDMSSVLKSKIINQDDAVDIVVDAVQRSKTGIRDNNKPIASFFMLGTTATGKTELAKQLAKLVFGSEENMIRLDMSEFSLKHEASKLIGSPPGFIGFEEGGQLTEKVRNKPYSLILLDEIEKAHPDIKNNLLQILDEGHITDSKGRKVDFKNCIIVMTSNIGTSKIIQDKSIGFGNNQMMSKEQLHNTVKSELKKHPLTTPEFLNRIDEIIIFNTLRLEDVSKILDIQLSILKQRILKERNLKLELTDEAKAFIAKEGYDPAYGARPLKRSITKHVENLISKSIVNKEVVDGDSIIIGFEDGKTILKK